MPGRDAVQITLMADYAPWCLWARGLLLPEDALPITPKTKQALRAWLNAYDTSSGRPSDWPMWRPPEGTEAGTDAEEEAWCAEGRRLAEAVQGELGPGYDVTFEA